MAFAKGEWYLAPNQKIRVGIVYKDHNHFCILGAQIKQPVRFPEEKHLLLEYPGVSAFVRDYAHWITVWNPGDYGVTFKLAVQRYNL